MKRHLPVAAIALAALTLAACDQPRTNSAYNNSGASATPLMPANPPAETAPAAPDAPAPAQSAVTTAPATSDTASPSTAALPEPAKPEASK